MSRPLILRHGFVLASLVMLSAAAVACGPDEPARAFIDTTVGTGADSSQGAADAGDAAACDCPDSDVCIEGQCRAALGAGCVDDDECASGECESVGQTSICTQSCEASCRREGLTCYRGQCLPDDFCSDPDGDRHGVGPGCKGPDCDEENARVNAGADEVCNGRDDDCDGQTDEAPECHCQPGDTRSCYEGSPATDGRGVCEPGEQTCQSDYTWGPCEEQTLPGAEICDGEDNDCDGAVDEEGPCDCTPGETRDCYSASMETADRGQCERGRQTCESDHTWGSCRQQILPSTEVCNGEDDDCDGSIDEDFDLQTDPDHCGGCNNRCNIPNGRAACSGGDCQIARCNANYWDNDGDVSNGCEYRCISRGAETCNGKDDDCDGTVDNGFGVGESCTGTGACGSGTLECQTPQRAVCSSDPEGSSSDASPETCNGEDDDCDGRTDEDFASLGRDCTAGVGACERRGVLDCAKGGKSTTCGATPGTPSPEICDGIDNDCDGRTDEDCQLADTSWPTYKYGVRRTGHNMNVQGPNSATVRWTFDLGTAGRVSPVVHTSGDILVGGGDELYMLTSSGNVAWQTALQSNVRQATVQSDGGIYVGAGERFYHLDPNGNVRWKRNLGSPVRSSIIDDDGNVYVTAGNELVALRPDGRRKWAFSGGGRLYPPALGSNRIYVSASNAIIYAVEPDGSLFREFLQQGADTDGGPAIGQDGTVYTPFSSRVFALDRTLRTVRWSRSTGGDIDSSPSIMNTGFQCCNPLDFLYVSANGNTGLQKLDFQGGLDWRFPMRKDGSGNGAPVFDGDGDAYVGDSGGTLYAVARNGASKWTIDLSSGDVWAAAIAPKRIYAVSGDTLYAVGP